MERDQCLLREQPVFRSYLLRGKWTSWTGQSHSSGPTLPRNPKLQAPCSPGRDDRGGSEYWSPTSCETISPNGQVDRHFPHLDLIPLSAHVSPIIAFCLMESKEIKHLPQLTIQGESCEGLLQSENEELLIWRGGKCNQTVNRVRINLWEIVKTRRGRGGGTKKEKRERKKCPLTLYLKSWKLQPSVECGSEHLPSQCSGDWGIFGGQSQLHNETLSQHNKTE